MLTYIFAALIIFIVQLFAGTLTRFGPMGTSSLAEGLRGRDALADRSPVNGRLERAKDNMIEALVIFMPLAILHHLSGPVPDQAMTGALVFLVARVVYIPAYASGILGLRTAVWGVGHFGLLMMALCL